MKSENFRAALTKIGNIVLVSAAFLLALALINKTFASPSPSAGSQSTRQPGLWSQRLDTWQEEVEAAIDRCDDSTTMMATKMSAYDKGSITRDGLLESASEAWQVCDQEWQQFPQKRRVVSTDTIFQSHIDRAFRDCKLAIFLRREAAKTVKSGLTGTLSLEKFETRMHRIVYDITTQTRTCDSTASSLRAVNERLRD